MTTPLETTRRIEELMNRHAEHLATDQGPSTDAGPVSRRTALVAAVNATTLDVTAAGVTFPACPVMDSAVGYVVGDMVVLDMTGYPDGAIPLVLGRVPNIGPAGGWAIWTPTITTDSGTVSISAHPANHARWRTFGKLCAISFSQVLAFGATHTYAQVTLPVNAYYARNVFAGDCANALARCSTFDAVDSVQLYRYDGATVAAGNFHYTFAGVYETV